MLDFGWICKIPRRLFKVEILTSDFQRSINVRFSAWINAWFSTLDQLYTYFVTDVMAVTDLITIIFVDGKLSSFFYVFLDLGWI